MDLEHTWEDLGIEDGAIVSLELSPLYEGRLPWQSKRITSLVTMTESPGRIAAADEDGTVSIWNSDTGVIERHIFNENCSALAYVGEQRLACACGVLVRVFKLEEGCQHIERSFKGHSAPILALDTVSPGRVASCSEDGTVRIWNMANCGEDREWHNMKVDIACERVLAGHTGPVTCVRHLGIGRLASGSEDKTIRIWNLQEETPTEMVLEGHEEGVNAIHHLSSTRLISGAYDKSVRLWDTDTGELLKILACHGLGIGGIFPVRRPLQRQTNATTGHVEENGTLGVVDKTLEILLDQEYVYETVMFLSHDHTARIWNFHIETLEAKRRSGGHYALLTICICLKGNRMAVGYQDGRVDIVHVSGEYPDAYDRRHRMRQLTDPPMATGAVLA